MSAPTDRPSASSPPPGSTSPEYRRVLQNSFQSLYDSGRDSWTEEPAMRHTSPLLTAALPPASRVLDVGAGRGRDTEELLATGHRVVAVDLVRLPEWEEIVQRWGSRVRFIEGDVRRVPEGDFDGVLDNGVLHHQLPQEYPDYLRALRQRLRPGGLLALSLFVRAGQDGRDAEEGVLHDASDGRLSREFTPAEAETMLSTAGFDTVTTRRVPRGRPEWAYLLVLARRREE